MSDALRGVMAATTVVVSRQSHAMPGSHGTNTPLARPQPGSEVWLQVRAIQPDGAIRFEADGLQLLLRNWPASLPLPAEGSRWPFRAGGPDAPWQLLTGSSSSPATDGHRPESNQLMVPVFRPQQLKPESLASSYREAVLGRLAAVAAQFHHEAGQHLSGNLLALSTELAAANWRQPAGQPVPFPLSLPLWLWGGPSLQLAVEDPPDGDDEDVPPLDLLWQLPMADGSSLHGRLRRLPGVIWLDVWGEESAQRQFALCWPGLAADYRAAGIRLDLHLGAAPRMHGLMLGMHGISLFEPTRLLVELFQAAAILFAALRPQPLAAGA